MWVSGETSFPFLFPRAASNASLPHARAGRLFPSLERRRSVEFPPFGRRRFSFREIRRVPCPFLFKRLRSPYRCRKDVSLLRYRSSSLEGSPLRKFFLHGHHDFHGSSPKLFQASLFFLRRPLNFRQNVPAESPPPPPSPSRLTSLPSSSPHFCPPWLAVSNYQDGMGTYGAHSFPSFCGRLRDFRPSAWAFPLFPDLRCHA